MVLVLLAGGAIAGFATGFIPGLFKKESAVEALYVGTENLLYETSSATIEVSAGATFSFQWEYGNDLRSSTFWGQSGGSGFVLKDDTLFVYSSSSSSDTGSEITLKVEDVVNTMNTALFQEYGVDVDLNRIVQNGRMDRAYLEELNRILSDANPSANTDDPFGFAPGSIDSERATEIINDFMTKEVDKEAVQNRFLSNVETNDNGGVTTHKGEFDLAGFIAALDDYAVERAKDSAYFDAANAIETFCAQARVLETYLTSLEYSISVKGGLLTALKVTIDTQGVAFSAMIEVRDVNATNLSNNAQLGAILSSPQ